MKENYLSVLNHVSAVCSQCNRASDEVTLIAVSKMNPVEAIQEVYDAGCRNFGENKVQELVEKYDKLPKDIHWHLIGHLQRNKVKYIIDKVTAIHSVDSIRLAEEISKEALKKNICMNILAEVNIAEETTKFGLLLQDVPDFVHQVSLLQGVRLIGFMTVAPYVENAEENRPYFAKMKQLSVDIKSENIDNVCMNQLSMGMSGDYSVAIEEGATLIRVGTSIFGKRNYALKENSGWE